MLRSKRFLLLTFVFCGAFVAGLTGMIRLPEINVRWPDIADQSSMGQRLGGEQLVLVYIGSSSCSWSNRDEIPGAIGTIQSRLRQYAEEAGLGFVSTGVAIDWIVDEGVEHLRSVGRFDQMVTGRNWSNMGALRYIWQTVPGRASTPQIVVVRRHMDVPTADGTVGAFSVSNVRLVTRKVGFTEIRGWADSGLPGIEP